LEEAELYKDNKGRPLRIVGAVKDVTEIRNTAKERELLAHDIENERDKLKTIIESVPEEIWVINDKEDILLLNPPAMERFGVGNIENLNLRMVLSKLEIRQIDGSPRNIDELGILQSLKGKNVSSDIMIQNSKSSEWGYYHINSAPMWDHDGNVFGAVAVVANISERKRTEQKIRELLSSSERRAAEFNAIIQSIPDAMFIGNNSGITICNDKALKLLGADSFDDLKNRIVELRRKFNIRKPDTGVPLNADELPFNRALLGEIVLEEVLATQPGTNQDLYIRIACAPVFLNNQVIAAVAIESDITEKIQAEKVMKASLVEKEVLLQEIYHRTKNNMQIISSILGLKAAAVKKKEIIEILEDVKGKIQTISLVHQMLYQSNNLSKINLADYIKNLVQLLRNNYLLDAEKVSFELEMENINILIDFAVPLGLIINELLSNSLKYAFPGDIKGNISIKLSKNENGLIEIRISDNGIGMKETDMNKNSSLGLKLLQILAEQLQAKTEYNIKNGVSWYFGFMDTFYSQRV
jgi:PAS domain S-box-containing protein